MKFNQITAGLAQTEDIDRILEINRLEYGTSDILATPADFAWRYDQNPVGQAIIPVIRDGSHYVVGFIWVVPFRLRVKGQNYLVATGTNLVIHPEYRNAFGYIKLIRQFEQVFRDHQLPLHFSFISEEKYRELAQHNPETAWTVPVLVKPLNFTVLAQTYFTRNWPYFIIGGAAQLITPLFFRRQQVVADEEITVQAIDQFDASFDKFWQEVQDKYPVMAIRDRAFLAWRFAQVSGRSYHILVAQMRGQMLGYIVLRCLTIRGIETGLIMDLLVTDGALGEVAGARLMAEAEIYFQTQRMAAVAGLMASFATEYRILRQAGYQYLPSTLPFTPRAFRFATFLHNMAEKNLVSLSKRDWFITIADYESF